MFISPHQLRQSVRILRAGGLLAHPTEGVWGLACDPLNPIAVTRLLAAKQRNPDKGFILVAAEAAMLQPYLAADSQDHLKKAQATWPGPNTWLLAANPALPWWITGAHESIATRVSDHPLVAALSQALGGALISSSANRSGHPAARNAWQVRAQLRPWLDGVLAGELQTPGQPSAIYDAASGQKLRG